MQKWIETNQRSKCDEVRLITNPSQHVSYEYHWHYKQLRGEMFEWFKCIKKRALPRRFSERLEMSKFLQVVYADDGPQKVRALDKVRVMSHKSHKPWVAWTFLLRNFGIFRFYTWVCPSKLKVKKKMFSKCSKASVRRISRHLVQSWDLPWMIETHGLYPKDFVSKTVQGAFAESDYVQSIGQCSRNKHGPEPRVPVTSIICTRCVFDLSMTFDLALAANMRCPVFTCMWMLLAKATALRTWFWWPTFTETIRIM